jgi:hypothetical protein
MLHMALFTIYDKEENGGGCLCHDINIVQEEE